MELTDINVLDYIDVKYVIATTLTTYLYLSRIVTKPSKIHQLISSFLIGCLLGFVWIKYMKGTIDIIFISFLVVQSFWVTILKPILSKFGHTYHNGKGVIK